ncbi:thioredoxin family protein [Pedobacter foliorum]|uniref:TlpA family protein disulfide reductase n=1 Tax=Pedobacter foliorum TaxID=2739058 RepID=UPI0015673D79|nr:thioredoxin family protein [Pedobacter foliorum]NRF38184.1 redoxin family protein [Pedobacter foliorum]
MRLLKKPVIFILLLWFSTAKAQNNVKLSGFCSDSSVEEISILRSYKFYPIGPEEKLKTVYSKDGHFDINFNLKAPEILIFRAKYKIWKLYFQPGDSLKFDINENNGVPELTFTGKTASRYNLFTLVSNATLSAPKLFQFKELKEYTDTLSKWKAHQHNFIKAYGSKNPLDPQTMLFAQNAINFRYVSLIYFLLQDLSEDTIPKDYLLEADRYKLNQDKLLILSEYRFALYQKFIARFNNKSSQNIEKVFENIMKNLQGQSRNFANANLIGEYVLKQSSKDEAVLKKALNFAYSMKPDSIYLSYLKENEERYFVLNRPLPDEILDHTFLTPLQANKKSTLREILSKYQNKGIYIDLWASWCAPCRKDIANSKTAKKILKDEDFVYLYFSTDKDATVWKNASIMDNIEENQFIFDHTSTSGFNKLLNLQEIPRYLLLDKNHHVKTLYAPRPDESSVEELRSKLNATPQK